MCLLGPLSGVIVGYIRRSFATNSTIEFMVGSTDVDANIVMSYLAPVYNLIGFTDYSTSAK